VLGNVGTFVSFRIGPEDAPYVVREFQSNFAQEDLIQLENYRIYLKLMINGMPSWPFSARTLRSSELALLAGDVAQAAPHQDKINNWRLSCRPSLRPWFLSASRRQLYYLPPFGVQSRH